MPSEQWPIEEFDYLDPAAYAATTYSERRGPRGAYWKRCDPLWTDSPASESFAGFIERVGRFERALIDRGARCTLVVYTHGFVMRALLWPRRYQIREVSSADMDDFYRFHRTIAVPNCGILAGSVDPGGRLLLPASVSIDHIPPDLRTA